MTDLSHSLFEVHILSDINPRFPHLFSVQFYPEYYAGSCDTENLFQILLYIFQSYKSTKPINAEKYLVEQLTKRVSDANAPPPAFC
ncbi:unnamed protein product, partial [Rotaria sp. Silwood1]